MSGQANGAGAPSPSKPRLTRGQKWLRRLRRLVMLAVALVLLVRLVVAVMLPYAIHKAANFYGVDCQYSRSKMGIVGGYANLWDVVITDQDTRAPVLKAEFCEATLSTWELLKGNLRIWRIGADGVEIHIDRAADGSLPMLKQFVAAQKGQAPAPQSPATQRELDLSAPLQIEALRLGRTALRIRDESVTPPFVATVYTTVRISNIGLPDRRAAIEIELTSDDLLDDLRVSGQARSAGRIVEAELRLRARGINPLALQSYLKGFNLAGRGHELDAFGTMHLTTAAVPHTLDALKASISLEDLRLQADGEDACRVKRISIAANYLSPTHIDLAKVEVAGVSVKAQRTGSGALGFAGIETAVAAPATRPATRAVVASSRPAPPLPQMTLRELVISDAQLRFADLAVEGQAQLGLDLKELRLRNLSNMPLGAGQPLDMSAELSAPQLASSIKVTGQAELFAETKTANLSVGVDGITLKAVAPYFKAIGLEPALHNATLNLKASASFQPQPGGQYQGLIRFNDISLSDTGELFRLSDGQITGLRLDPATLALSIDAIDIAGPHLVGLRDRTGQVELLGLRTTTPAARPQTRPTTTVATAAAAPAEGVTSPIPEFRLKRFTWKDISLELHDEMTAPATTLKLRDAGMEITDLLLTSQPATRPAAPAGVHAYFSLPGLIDHFDLIGSFVLTPTSFAFDVRKKAMGISGQMLAPYLAPLHVTPTLRHADLAAQASGRLQLAEDGMRGTLLVHDVSFTEGQWQYASLESLRIDGLRVRDDCLSVDAIEVARPLVDLTRNDDGSFSTLGMRIAPPPVDPNAPFTTPHLPPLPAVSLARFGMVNAQVNWADRMFTPAVQASLHANLEMSGLQLGQQPATATISATAAIDQRAGNASFKGTLSTAPDSYSLQAEVSATGVRPGPLEAYLPPTLAPTLNSGELSAKLDVAVANHPQNGISARIEVRDLSLRDSGNPLASISSITAMATRIDPDNLIIALDELSLTGIKATVHRTADSQIAGGGMRTVTATSPSRPRLTGKAATTQPTEISTKDIGHIVAAARRASAEIAIAKVLISGDEIRIVDDSRPSAAPLVITDLRLENTRQLAVLGKNAADQPASEFQLSLKASPVVRSVLLKVQTAPFANQPTAKATLTVTGIDGAGLAQVVPELSKYLDVSGLKDGRFEATLDGSAKVERRGPVAIDFTRGLTADLTLSNIAFRNGDSDRILLGLKELRVNQARVEPGSQRVSVASIELTQPIAYLRRDQAGIHACGLTMPLQAKSTATTAPTTRPLQASAPRPTPRTATGFEIRKLTVSGIDFVYEDQASQPPLLIPLNQLEAEVQDIGDFSAAEARPLRFSAILNSGKAPMRPRGSREPSPALQEREIFALATANGSLTLAPQLNGWTKASISAVDLVAFHGLAKDEGIELYNGSFDGDLDLRITSQTDATVRAKAVVTDLSISESPEGPLARTLKLPMPLNSAIDLLTDADGSISLPVSFKVTNGQVSTASLVDSVFAAGVQAIGAAIATSPLKLAGALMGGEKKPAFREEVGIPFKPGSCSIEPADKAALDGIIKDLRGKKDMQVTIRHQPGRQDMVLESARANPTSADLTDLIASLRLRKQQLMQQRRELAVAARTNLFLSTNGDANSQLDRLRNCDEELAATESSLDKLLDLLRPGADRQAARRSRAMGIELAEARLAAVQTYLLNSGIAKVQDRITLAPASGKVDEQSPDQGQVVVTLTPRK